MIILSCDPLVVNDHRRRLFERSRYGHTRSHAVGRPMSGGPCPGGNGWRRRGERHSVTISSTVMGAVMPALRGPGACGLLNVGAYPREGDVVMRREMAHAGAAVLDLTVPCGVVWKTGEKWLSQTPCRSRENGACEAGIPTGVRCGHVKRGASPPMPAGRVPAAWFNCSRRFQRSDAVPEGQSVQSEECVSC